MTDYLLRLLVMLPLLGGAAWGSLWLWKKAQTRLGPRSDVEKAARLIDVVPLAPQAKLVVVAFGGRDHLLAISRAGIVALASDERGDFHA